MGLERKMYQKYKASKMYFLKGKAAVISQAGKRRK